MIEEAKNIFIENAGLQLFTQLVNFKVEQESITDSVYLHLLSYWLNLMEDQNNLKFSATIFMHALNTIKSMLLTSSMFSCRF